MKETDPLTLSSVFVNLPNGNTLNILITVSNDDYLKLSGIVNDTEPEFISYDTKHFMQLASNAQPDVPEEFWEAMEISLNTKISEVKESHKNVL